MALQAVSSPCPLCGGREGSAFWEVKDVPVHCNVLRDDRASALAVPRADIRLVLCDGCGLVYNDRFDPAVMTYVEGYENSLHHSGVFRAYADELARRLVDRYGLRDKDVIELGCGRGDFLRQLCTLGGNRGLGLDPSYPGDELTEPDGDGVRILRRSYADAPQGLPVDLVCCRHVLEHIQHPLDLLGVVRERLEGRPDTVVCFEVPNALFTLESGGIWDVIYEHCSYFTPAALTEAFVRAGLRPDHVESGYGGQFLTIEGRAAKDAGRAGEAAGAVRDELRATVERFSAEVSATMAGWREELAAWGRDGRDVVIWGAGSKGVSFLNMLGAGDEVVGRAVDLNPAKHGMHIAGTGQLIVAPEALAEAPPAVVIVMNPLYRDEIAGTLEAMGVDAEVRAA